MTNLELKDTRPAGAAPGASEGLTSTRHIAQVIGVLVVSALIMILNETVLSVALPQLMGTSRSPPPPSSGSPPASC